MSTGGPGGVSPPSCGLSALRDRPPGCLCSDRGRVPSRSRARRCLGREGRFGGRWKLDLQGLVLSCSPFCFQTPSQPRPCLRGLKLPRAPGRVRVGRHPPCEGRDPPFSVWLPALRSASRSAVSGARARVAFTCGRSRSRTAVSLPVRAVSPHRAAAGLCGRPLGPLPARDRLPWARPRVPWASHALAPGGHTVPCARARPRLPPKIRTCILLLSKAVFGGHGFRSTSSRGLLSLRKALGPGSGVRV